MTINGTDAELNSMQVMLGCPAACDIAFVAMRAALIGRYLAEHIWGARLFESEGSDTFPFHVGDIAWLRSSIEVSLTGIRHVTTPRRRLATVMMTDVVGSTAIAAQVGDTRWREMMHEHDTVIRRTIAQSRGDEIAHTGDGIVAGFDRPTSAVLCARHISNALSEMGLKVRIGLHAGEIDVGPDGTTGLAIHLVSRIMSVATAGGIVVSRTVRDLMLGSDIAFEDLGQHQLKGVPETWALYRVAGDRRRPHPKRAESSTGGTPRRSSRSRRDGPRRARHTLICALPAPDDASRRGRGDVPMCPVGGGPRRAADHHGSDARAVPDVQSTARDLANSRPELDRT